MSGWPLPCCTDTWTKSSVSQRELWQIKQTTTRLKFIVVSRSLLRTPTPWRPLAYPHTRHHYHNNLGRLLDDQRHGLTMMFTVIPTASIVFPYVSQAFLRGASSLSAIAASPRHRSPSLAYLPQPDPLTIKAFLSELSISHISPVNTFFTFCSVDPRTIVYNLLFFSC